MKTERVLGLLLFLAGIAVAAAFDFYMGLAICAAAVNVGLWSWRKSSSPGRELFFYGGVQTVFNVALIFAIFALSLASFVGRTGQSFLRDFSAVYVGAELAKTDMPSLYDLDKQFELEKEVTGLPLKEDDLLPFPYPPFLGLLLSPLSLLSFGGAFKAWACLSLVILGFCVFLLARGLELSRDTTQVLVLFTSMFIPVYVTLIQGQTSFLVLLLLTLFFLRARDPESSEAGFWAGFLWIKPHFFLIPCFVLLVRRNWRGLLAAGLVSGGLAGFSWVLVGTEGILAYLKLIQQMGKGEYQAVALDRMHNLRALLLYLNFGDVVWLAGVGIALGLIFWVYSKGPHLHYWLSACALGSVLFSPHLYMQDIVALIVPAGLALAASRPITARERWFFFFLAWFPFLGLLLYAGMETGWPVIPAAVALLFGWALWKAASPTNQR
jgi:hypothetical protein